MILFVDDMPERWANFQKRFPAKAAEATWVATLEEACVALLQFQFEEVWLDHDCGFFTKDPAGEPCCFVTITFRAVACMLAAMDFQGPIYLHSGNPAGRAWMQSILPKAIDACALVFSPGDSVLD